MSDLLHEKWPSCRCSTLHMRVCIAGVHECFVRCRYRLQVSVASFRLFRSRFTNRRRSWFVNLSTVGGFFGWWGMNLTYIFFCERFLQVVSAKYTNALSIDRGMRAQGIDRKKLVYHSNLQPWLSYWGVSWTTLFILINGFEVFWKFNVSSFLTHCTSTRFTSDWTQLKN